MNRNIFLNKQGVHVPPDPQLDIPVDKDWTDAVMEIIKSKGNRPNVELIYTKNYPHITWAPITSAGAPKLPPRPVRPK